MGSINDRTGLASGNLVPGGYTTVAPDEIVVTAGDYRNSPWATGVDPWARTPNIDYSNPNLDNLFMAGQNPTLQDEPSMLASIAGFFDGSDKRQTDPRSAFMDALKHVLGIDTLTNLGADMKNFVNSAARMLGFGDAFVQGATRYTLGGETGSEAFDPMANETPRNITGDAMSGWQNGGPNANVQGPINTVIPIVGTDGLENIVVIGNVDQTVHFFTPDDIRNMPGGFGGLENVDFGLQAPTPEPPSEETPTENAGEPTEEIVVRGTRPTPGTQVRPDTPIGDGGEITIVGDNPDMPVQIPRMPTQPAPDTPIGEGDPIDVIAHPLPPDFPIIPPVKPKDPDLPIFEDGPQIPESPRPRNPNPDPPYYGTPPTNTPPQIPDFSGPGGPPGSPVGPPTVNPPLPPAPRPRQGFRFFDMPEFEILDNRFGRNNNNSNGTNSRIENDGRVTNASDPVPNFAAHA